MQRPIFMLVSGDARRLDALRHDLSRRYEADYQVCVASSAAAALTMLAVLAGAHAEVALVIADEHLADVPYWYFDQGSAEGRRLLYEHDLDGGPLPVVLAHDGSVLVNPSHEDLLATLGLPSALGTRACDVAIIGAGPAGLAAAVYAAS